MIYSVIHEWYYVFAHLASFIQRSWWVLVVIVGVVVDIACVSNNTELVVVLHLQLTRRAWAAWV